MRIFSFICLPLSPSHPPSSIFPHSQPCPPSSLSGCLCLCLPTISFPHHVSFLHLPLIFSALIISFSHTWTHTHTRCCCGVILSHQLRSFCVQFLKHDFFFRTSCFKIIYLVYFFQKEDLHISQCQCTWLIMVDLLWKKWILDYTKTFLLTLQLLLKIHCIAFFTYSIKSWDTITIQGGLHG